jgi:flagellar biosynthetic protein FliP
LGTTVRRVAGGGLIVVAVATGFVGASGIHPVAAASAAPTAHPSAAVFVVTSPTAPPATTTPSNTLITVAPPGSIDSPTVDSPSVASPNDSDITISAPTGTSNAVLLLVLVTLISLVPGLLMLCTTFPRFLVVLGLSRQALGLNTTPPNQVLAGLAAFLTFFVMAPVFSEINTVAIQPAIHGEITQGDAIEKGWEPLRDFMLDRTRDSDISMLYDLTDTARPTTADDVSPRFLIPAFILSELRAAFLIGFLIWVPFLLIDLIVSSVLAGLGMLMMPPVVVSLPVKLALFVLVDGWALLTSSLLRSAT